ncbi:MAG: hypothetical protein ACK5PF_07215 [bacterium]|jgi:hypothetical protein
MNCSICHKPIVLSPSAAERAAKDVTGRPASFYTGLFREHTECQLAKRQQETSDLMRRLARN